MDLLEGVQKVIQKEKLLCPHENVLVAVSGGMDSVALAKILCLLKYKVSLAHVNYNLRGEESKGDEGFVRALSKELHVPLYIKQIEISSSSSLQEHARQLRYEWFRELQQKYGLQKLATAHHANDQIETILMRIFLRRVSTKALAGIPLKNKTTIRPLLAFTKQEIEDWMNEQHFSFRTDSSNSSLDYDRNIVRNVFIPSLKKYFPQFEKNLLNNIDHWKEASLMQSHYLDQRIKKHIKEKGSEVFFPIRYLEKSGFAKTLLWHYAEKKKFTSAQVNEVIRLFHATNGSFVKSVSHRFIKHEQWLILTSLVSGKKNKIVFIEKEGEYSFGKWNLSIKKVEELPHIIKMENPLEEYVCLDNVDFPLMVRPWKTGDYFYPLGMKKQKKIARFLIDEKTPLLEKEDIWVLVTDKKVITLLGKRLDERFKVTPSSKTIYKLKLTKL